MAKPPRGAGLEGAPILPTSSTKLLLCRIIKLNNYVVQLIGVASVLLRHGSFTIFLLLNNMSHDAHFSTRQNMEPEESLEKKSNFSLKRVF